MNNIVPTLLHSLSLNSLDASEEIKKLQSELPEFWKTIKGTIRFGSWCEQLENEKTGKTVKRFILVTSFRIYSIKKTPLIGFKVRHSHKFMDVRVVKVASLAGGLVHVNLITDTPKSPSLTLHLNLDIAIDLVACVKSCIGVLNLNFPRLRKTIFSIPERFMRDIDDLGLVADDTMNVLTAYLSACNYLDTEPFEKVSNYFEEFVQTESTNPVFDLSKILAFMEGEKIVVLDFKQTSSIAFALQSFPLLHAVRLADLNIRDDGLLALRHIFTVNEFLRNVSIDNIGINPRGAASLADWLTVRNAPLDLLSIRNCKIGNRGLATLSLGMRGMPLRVLTLRACGFGHDGARHLCEALSSDVWYSSLESLDVGENKFGLEGSYVFARWLGSAKALKSLIMDDTGVKISVVVSALATNQSMRLETIDFSKNELTKDSASALSTFVEFAPALRHLAMARVRFRDLQFQMLLRALALNGTDGGVSLDVRGCQLKETCTWAFESLFKDDCTNFARSFCALDLSENGLGAAGTIRLCESLVKFKTLKRLSLDQNIVKVKPGMMLTASDAIISVLGNSRALQHFSIRGCPNEKFVLKNILIPVIRSLRLNTSLVSLDISSNLMGDNGFFELAEALGEIGNRSLRTIKCDNNKMGVSGCIALCNAIEQNTVLCQIVADNDLKRVLSSTAKRNTASLRSVIEMARASLNDNEQVARDNGVIEGDISDLSNIVECSHESTVLTKPRQGLVNRQLVTMPHFLLVDQQRYKNSAVRLDACCLPEQNANMEFGVALSDLAPDQTVLMMHYVEALPSVLVRIFRAVVLLGGVQEQRVFALSADPEKMKEYKSLLNSGKFLAASDCQALASLIRVWLAEQPRRLLGGLETESVMTAEGDAEVAAVIDTLEPSEQALMTWLLDIFAYTARSAQRNGLTVSTLARIFASVMFAKSVPSDAAVRFLAQAIHMRSSLTDKRGELVSTEDDVGDVKTIDRNYTKPTEFALSDIDSEALSLSLERLSDAAPSSGLASPSSGLASPSSQQEPLPTQPLSPSYVSDGNDEMLTLQLDSMPDHFEMSPRDSDIDSVSYSVRENSVEMEQSDSEIDVSSVGGRGVQSLTERYTKLAAVEKRRNTPTLEDTNVKVVDFQREEIPSRSNTTPRDESVNGVIDISARDITPIEITGMSASKIDIIAIDTSDSDDDYIPIITTPESMTMQDESFPETYDESETLNYAPMTSDRRTRKRSEKVQKPNVSGNTSDDMHSDSQSRQMRKHRTKSTPPSQTRSQMRDLWNSTPTNSEVDSVSSSPEKPQKSHKPVRPKKPSKLPKAHKPSNVSHASDSKMSPPPEKSAQRNSAFLEKLENIVSRQQTPERVDSPPVSDSSQDRVLRTKASRLKANEISRAPEKVESQPTSDSSQGRGQRRRILRVKANSVSKAQENAEIQPASDSSQNQNPRATTTSRVKAKEVSQAPGKVESQPASDSSQDRVQRAKASRVKSKPISKTPGKVDTQQATGSVKNRIQSYYQNIVATGNETRLYDAAIKTPSDSDNESDEVQSTEPVEETQQNSNHSRNPTAEMQLPSVKPITTTTKTSSDSNALQTETYEVSRDTDETIPDARKQKSNTVKNNEEIKKTTAYTGQIQRNNKKIRANAVQIQPDNKKIPANAIQTQPDKSATITTDTNKRQSDATKIHSDESFGLPSDTNQLPSDSDQIQPDANRCHSDVDEQPSDVDEQPSDVDEQLSDVDEQLSDVHEQLSDIDEQPSDVDEQPAYVDGPPSDVDDFDSSPASGASSAEELAEIDELIREKKRQIALRQSRKSAKARQRRSTLPSGGHHASRYAQRRMSTRPESPLPSMSSIDDVIYWDSKMASSRNSRGDPSIDSKMTLSSMHLSQNLRSPVGSSPRRSDSSSSHSRSRSNRSGRRTMRSGSRDTNRSGSGHRRRQYGQRYRYKRSQPEPDSVWEQEDETDSEFCASDGSEERRVMASNVSDKMFRHEQEDLQPERVRSSRFPKSSMSAYRRPPSIAERFSTCHEDSPPRRESADNRSSSQKRRNSQTMRSARHDPRRLGHNSADASRSASFHDHRHDNRIASIAESPSPKKKRNFFKMFRK